jgi:hypothetical protein
MNRREKTTQHGLQLLQASSANAQARPSIIVVEYRDQRQGSEHDGSDELDQFVTGIEGQKLGAHPQNRKSDHSASRPDGAEDFNDMHVLVCHGR